MVDPLKHFYQLSDDNNVRWTWTKLHRKAYLELYDVNKEHVSKMENFDYLNLNGCINGIRKG